MWRSLESPRMLGTHPVFAARAGQRLASARSWSLSAGRPDASSGKFLDTRYARFCDDPRLCPFASAVYQLEISERPILWINAEHGRVQTLLADRATRGWRARTRDLLFELISQAVWTQLFVHCALGLMSAGRLPGEWEESVLIELLPGLYPGQRSHELRLRAFSGDLDRGLLVELLARLDASLQRRHSLADHASKLALELEPHPERR